MPKLQTAHSVTAIHGSKPIAIGLCVCERCKQIVLQGSETRKGKLPPCICYELDVLVNKDDGTVDNKPNNNPTNKTKKS